MSHKKTNHKPSYAIVSLGCPKNLVDSERMAGLLEQAGYRLRAEPAGADVAVVNTCGFIGDARAESYSVIEELLKLKKQGRLGKIVVTGCLAEREKESLFERYPEIDTLLGVFARDEIARSLVQLDSPNFHAKTSQNAAENQEKHLALFRPAPVQPLHDGGRRRITLPHLAYLKIAEGCNRLCSFCSIPLMRGPYASKPIDEVVAEARALAADGVRELVLVAQDTTFYGVEATGQPQLAALLRRLEGIDGLAWIRLMYLYPAHVTDELLDVMAASQKILPYLDMPLQHINDEVLRRMRRKVNRDETERLLDRLHEKIPSLALRTTLLTGFPGETEAQFEELLEFVQRRRFERLGVFAFCSEPGTPAAELDGQMPEEVKQHRRNRLMAAQQEIAFAWNAAQVGKTFDVLIDRCVSAEEHAYVGRTYADAPEVDDCVYVTGKGLAPGQIAPCEIVAAKEYDLIGMKNED